MPKDYRDRDSRRSWRDIDRKKDGSKHIDQTDPYKKAKRGARTENSSKSYKAALDSFFDGGALPERYQKLAKTRDELKKSGGSPRQTAIKKLADAVGQSEVIAALRAYLEVDEELPRDPDALLNVLQHPDEFHVRNAIRLLEDIVATRPLKRQEVLRQRLRRIEDLAEEPETAELAEQLRRKL